jgi:aspartyl-tRNA(Asn)/glutamyl-tRNA(Gln) amidotransferase subunit C
MLTKQEVQHIAQLARLKLTSAEEEKYSKELSSILDYVSQLQKVDTKKVEPTSQVTGLVNMTQADKITEPRVQQELIKQAPQTEGRQIKVKAVFE